VTHFVLATSLIGRIFQVAGNGHVVSFLCDRVQAFGHGRDPKQKLSNRLLACSRRGFSIHQSTSDRSRWRATRCHGLVAGLRSSGPIESCDFGFLFIDEKPFLIFRCTRVANSFMDQPDRFLHSRQLQIFALDAHGACLITWVAGRVPALISRRTTI
jgi:hypothetical protein